MEKNYMENQEETEIYLKDLFFYLIKRWRSLLVVILVGALLGGGFSAARSMRKSSEVSVEELAETYDPDQTLLEEMEMAARYRMMYNRQEQYMQNSILMQLDPNAYYQGTLILYLSAGADTGKISVEYQSLAFDPSLYEDFKNEMNYDGDSSYLNEVFQITSKNFDKELDSNSIIATEEDQLTYTWQAVDEESCSEMLAVIQDHISEIDNELNGEYDDYSMGIILSETNRQSNDDYLSSQKTQLENLNTYYKRMIELEDDFSDDDLEYYQAVYLTDFTEEGLFVEETEEIEETETEQEPADTKNSGLNISFKWIIFGVFGMILLWGVVLVIRYLVDVSIKTQEEIKDTYSLPILGRVDAGNTRKGIDGWLDSLYKKTEEPADTIPYISSNISALNASGIALCGDTGDKMVSSVMEELKRSSKQVECMPFIGEDDTALKRTTELGKEIMIIQTGSTSRKTVQRELELCELQHIDVLGVIVIENF